MIPKLRFKEFNDEWINVKVSDIFELKRGKVIPKTEISIKQDETHKYPVYSSQTANKGILGYHIRYDFTGDFITWTTNGANAGTVFYRKGKFCCTNVCGVLKPKKKDYANDCIAHILNKIAYKYVSHVGNPILMNNVMAEIPISIPSLPEQQKIADFLSTVDEKITCQKEQIDTLENLKKGYMQKIFTREIRFKDDDGKEYPDWEEKKLGEIADIKKGQQVNGNELSSKGKYYLLNGGINPSGYYDRYNTEKDTISISEGGNSCGYVNYITGNINSYYLYSYLKYKENNIMNLRVGSGLPNIQKKDVLIYPVVLPIPSEQQKIANFLLTFDEKIDIAKEKLEHWENIKKGLLQQMFI
jgi:type I restriction enzyme S subunit